MARKKQMATFTIDRGLLDRLDAFVTSQEFPPSKSGIVEAALKEWLDRRDAPKKKS